MTSVSLIEVVQDAVDTTGMSDVSVEDQTRLLSENGPGYISPAFRECLQLVGIRHIFAAPFHPQTNRKLERYHQTLKRDVNQVPYDVPEDLKAAIDEFVSYYNFCRFHNALGDPPQADRPMAGRKTGRDPRAQKGGESQDYRATKASQRDPQAATLTSPISLLPICPKTADVQ